MPDGSATPEPKLPEDLAVCHGLIRELLAANASSQRRIGHLEHQLDQLLKRLYGPRADKLNPDQASLFGDPPPEPALPPPVDQPLESRTESKSKGHGRKSLPKNLRRETLVVDIPEAEKLALGGTWVKIGEEVSEKLDFTPSSLFVRRTVPPKYVVRFEAKPDELKIAELPPEALPKCKAAPGLVADIVVSKLVDHLRLYRQKKRYARQGIQLSRSTLCGWLAEAADVLTPLYALLKARVLAAKVLHTDDTPIPVQDPYAVEHEAKDLDAAARAALRQQKAKPLLDALKEWLDREQAMALPKTPIGEAFTYRTNQWTALNVYVRDGDLAIDNNSAERAVKPFAIG
jgi:transposase